MSKYPYKAKFKTTPWSRRFQKVIDALGDRSVIVTGVKPGCVHRFENIQFPKDIQDKFPIVCNTGVRKSTLIPIEEDTE